MQKAFYRGLYQDLGSWTPSFSCPSDCKWSDEYIVLGLAGACENVTISTLGKKRCSLDEPVDGHKTCRMKTPRGVSIDVKIFPSTLR